MRGHCFLETGPKEFTSVFYSLQNWRVCDVLPLYLMFHFIIYICTSTEKCLNVFLFVYIITLISMEL